MQPRDAEDGQVLRFTPAGDIRWLKTFGGSGFDAAEFVIEFGQDQYLFAGHSRSKDGDIVGHQGYEDALLIPFLTDCDAKSADFIGMQPFQIFPKS